MLTSTQMAALRTLAYGWTPLVHPNCFFTNQQIRNTPLYKSFYKLTPKLVELMSEPLFVELIRKMAVWMWEDCYPDAAQELRESWIS